MMTQRRAEQRGFTIVEVLVVAGIFLVMFMALAPFVQMARMRANRINCTNNLRKISLGLHTYAVNHNNIFPPDLGALYPDYIESKAIFECPAKKSFRTSGKPDYAYTAGLTEASPSKTIIVEDINGNHKNAGKNVLRIDGSVEWVSGKR